MKGRDTKITIKCSAVCCQKCEKLFRLLKKNTLFKKKSTSYGNQFLEHINCSEPTINWKVLVKHPNIKAALFSTAGKHCTVEMSPFQVGIWILLNILVTLPLSLSCIHFCYNMLLTNVHKTGFQNISGTLDPFRAFKKEEELNSILLMFCIYAQKITCFSEF